MHWITDIINVLLTGAIAYAGYRQYVVSRQLLALQNAIENERHQVSLFLPIRETPTAGGIDAVLEITNLSSFGIWLESVRVHIAPTNGQLVALEQKLMAGDTFPFPLRTHLANLVGLTPGASTATSFWVVLKYSINGKSFAVETKHYQAMVGRINVQRLQLEEGTSLEPV